MGIIRVEIEQFEWAGNVARSIFQPAQPSPGRMAPCVLVELDHGVAKAALLPKW